MTRRALTFTLLVCAVGCSKPLDPPPAPVTITQATFEPVYRASKTIQAATGTGVTYAKFGELLQSFAAELSIAKDHRLNDADKQLLALYEEAHAAYKFSLDLWTERIARETKGDGKSEVGVSLGDIVFEKMMTGAKKYGLPILPRVMPNGVKVQVVPEDAAQRVWTSANATLEKATEMYYGRATPPDKK